MTPEFDKFVELFMEARSFLELPDEPPYGFWISPHGDFYPVAFEDHYSTALKIINENPKLKQEFNPNRDYVYVYAFLASRKYIRMVIDFKKYLADIFYYDRSQNTVPIIPSSTSLKLIKDIGEFYNLRIEFVKK